MIERGFVLLIAYSLTAVIDAYFLRWRKRGDGWAFAVDLGDRFADHDATEIERQYENAASRYPRLFAAAVLPLVVVRFTLWTVLAIPLTLAAAHWVCHLRARQLMLRIAAPQQPSTRRIGRLRESTGTARVQAATFIYGPLCVLGALAAHGVRGPILEAVAIQLIGVSLAGIAASGMLSYVPVGDAAERAAERRVWSDHATRLIALIPIGVLASIALVVILDLSTTAARLLLQAGSVGMIGAAFVSHLVFIEEYRNAGRPEKLETQYYRLGGLVYFNRFDKRLWVIRCNGYGLTPNHARVTGILVSILFYCWAALILVSASRWWP